MTGLKNLTLEDSQRGILSQMKFSQIKLSKKHKKGDVKALVLTFQVDYIIIYINVISENAIPLVKYEKQAGNGISRRHI